MDEITRKKLIAVGKMAVGGGRLVSGALMATGHGLIGAALRRHHMMGAAMHYGQRSVEAGKAMFEEGQEEWEAADETFHMSTEEGTSR